VHKLGKHLRFHSLEAQEGEDLLDHRGDQGFRARREEKEANLETFETWKIFQGTSRRSMTSRESTNIVGEGRGKDLDC
jgi:hypothetical protein